jgi:hypothetical protein
MLRVQETRGQRTGLFPVRADHPVSDAEHDLNWAEFPAVALLDVVDAAGPRLDPARGEEINRALRLTADFIRPRQLGLAWHNFHAVRASDLFRAATRLGDSTLAQRAHARLDTLASIMRQRRDRSEYNSPTYRWVAATAMHLGTSSVGVAADTQR